MIEIIQTNQGELIIGNIEHCDDYVKISNPMYILPDDPDNTYLTSFSFERVIPHQLSDDKLIKFNNNNIAMSFSPNDELKDDYTKTIEVMYCDDFDEIFQNYLKNELYNNVLTNFKPDKNSLSN